MTGFAATTQSIPSLRVGRNSIPNGSGSWLGRAGEKSA